MIPTQYLNQSVFVRMDRPLGSHHPKYDFVYPVNYGFVPDTVSGDGEELDAYILGVKEQLSEFNGICIAIIHRMNDDDDKLVVVPEGVSLSDLEIEEQTAFQEKWFRHAIVRNPFVTRTHRGIYASIRRENQILLIRKARGPYTGLYDLPGGSPEAGETPEQTLIREIREETGCTVTKSKFLYEKTIFFSDFTLASGEKGCMQHTGVLFDAEVSGTPATSGDGLDSGGAEWVDIKTLTSQNATPFALMAAGKEVIALANESDWPVDVGVRRAFRPDNHFPMIAGVILQNSKGNIILSKVAQTKKADAGKWSYSSGGHVEAGESYEEAAIRELQEELGVRGQIESLLGVTHTMRGDRIRAFHHVFRVISDDPITPDPVEIDEVREFTPTELRAFMQQHPDQFKDSTLEILKNNLK